MEGTIQASVVLAGVNSPFLIEGLSPFNAVKETMPLDAIKEVQIKPKKGFLSRIFS
jgi:hypothetical protein